MRKTWAPRGCTPILRHSAKHDRISTISALTVSSRHRHLGLYVNFSRDNITGVEVVRFLRHLLRHLAGPIVLLWDGGTIHRRALVTAFLHRHPRLHVYRFPAYAPDLNPDEFVWAQAKRFLANGAAMDIEALAVDVRRAVYRVKRSHRLLRSCLHASQLPWDR